MLSISQLFGFPIKFISEDVYRSVLVVELEKREHVDRLLERGIIVLQVLAIRIANPTDRGPQLSH